MGFRRGPTGWTHVYKTSGATHPGLGISSEGTIHAVFYLRENLYSLTGRNGSYAIEVFEAYPVTGSATAFAMAGDRPLLAYGRRFGFHPRREPFVLAEKLGGQWRRVFITPPAFVEGPGSELKLAADADVGISSSGLLPDQLGQLPGGPGFVVEGSFVSGSS